MKKYFAAPFLLSLIVIIAACSSIANEVSRHNFNNWLDKFTVEARQAGISEATLHNFASSAEFLPKAIELDRKQPDKIKTFAQYLKLVQPESRIRAAREKYNENKQLLNEIGKKYGVQPRFIVALWGSESDFGRNMGSFSVPSSLATLAYEGRRADFFKSELINALKIVDSQHISLSQMKGSWAGAMGQSQFMPSSFLAFAVDYDGDGNKDIWATKADVFASIANYLSQSGWDSSATWGREVKLPKGFNQKLIGKNVEKTLAQWRALGVKNTNGSAIPLKKGLMASVVLVEDSKNSRAFLIYPNYKVLLKWNRSLYFASAVSMLADKTGH